jgi:hypothetical protein
MKLFHQQHTARSADCQSLADGTSFWDDAAVAVYDRSGAARPSRTPAPGPALRGERGPTHGTLWVNSTAVSLRLRLAPR